MDSDAPQPADEIVEATEAGALSPAAELERRLNAAHPREAGYDELWDGLNRRLHLFPSRPPLRWAVEPWSASGLATPADPHPFTNVLYRWQGEAFHLFLDPSFFGTRDAATFYVMDRAFITGVALSFARRFRDLDEREMQVCLADFGREDMVSYTGTSSTSALLPHPSFFQTHGYEWFRARVNTGWIPWERRRRIAIWRGGLHGRASRETDDVWQLPRAHLCARAESISNRTAIDAKLTTVSNSVASRFGKRLDALVGLFGDPVDPIEFLSYRYQIDIDGWANSWSGLFQKLLTGSAVLKVESPHSYRQWYYDRLQPWVNYVPVKSDLSDLDSALEFVLASDEEARQIGIAGRHLALSLSLEAEIFAMVSVVERCSMV